MKQQDRITRAYRSLTADRLATLAFHYMTVTDDMEFRRVTDAVELKDYRCPDVAYHARLDACIRFSGYWAIEYWRLRCQKAESLSGVLAANRKGKGDQADAMLEAYAQYEAYLLALDNVLLTICETHNLDPADVRRIAGAEPFKPMREGVTPDEGLQAAMQSVFTELMSV